MEGVVSVKSFARAMVRFRDTKTLQRFSVVHACVYNPFNLAATSPTAIHTKIIRSRLPTAADWRRDHRSKLNPPSAIVSCSNNVGKSAEDIIQTWHFARSDRSGALAG